MQSSPTLQKMKKISIFDFQAKGAPALACKDLSTTFPLTLPLALTRNRRYVVLKFMHNTTYSVLCVEVAVATDRCPSSFALRG